MRWACALLLLVSCAEATPPPSPVRNVTVAPQSSDSPNEPTLLVGPLKPLDVTNGDLERVKVLDERVDASFKPPRERCPDGIGEMMSTHLRLGESMELAAGARPVVALGETTDAVDITFDRKKAVVRATAKRNGLIFLVVERDAKCTLYGINAGY